LRLVRRGLVNLTGPFAARPPRLRLALAH
jgi:hypothetical protein